MNLYDRKGLAILGAISSLIVFSKRFYLSDMTQQLHSMSFAFSTWKQREGLSQYYTI